MTDGQWQFAPVVAPPSEVDSKGEQECGLSAARDSRHEIARSDIRVVCSFDLELLLYPTRAFAHPMDVVRDFDPTPNEKRAILAFRASDASALRRLPSCA